MSDGMNCNSIFLIIPGEVNMYLTSHLRHTVDKAALDRISKVFYIRGIIIFGSIWKCTLTQFPERSFTVAGMLIPKI